MTFRASVLYGVRFERTSYTVSVVYLLSVILGVSAQDVTKKRYTQKSSNGTFIFGAIMSLAAMAFFALLGGEMEWELGFLPYSLGFAVAYSLVTVCGVSAIACGPLSITALVISYSLMLPTLYGLIFLGDPVTVGLVAGIAFLVVSLFLVTKKNKDAPLTLKWGVYAVLAFVGNGMCSVVQKMQQDAFDGRYKNEFMIAAYAMVAVVLFVFALVKERSVLKQNTKAGWYLAILCGAMNGMVNLFILILSGRMPLSLMFPLVSAGGIILTYFISKFVYKETLTKMQFVGFVLGIGSVVLLNI